MVKAQVPVLVCQRLRMARPHNRLPLRVLAKDVSQSPPTSRLAHPMQNLPMALHLTPHHEKHARRVQVVEQVQVRVVARVAPVVKAASAAAS